MNCILLSWKDARILFKLSPFSSTEILIMTIWLEKGLGRCKRLKKIIDYWFREALWNWENTGWWQDSAESFYQICDSWVKASTIRCFCTGHIYLYRNMVRALGQISLVKLKFVPVTLNSQGRKLRMSEWGKRAQKPTWWKCTGKSWQDRWHL